ncbi:hypothetical protein [Coleofasciculus sp. H7-2]|uniref:hypothetical protein n=1 Tax=Coleofasciculus sp. H7-2 TaxID=3351545 RepID=UPI0036718C0C
MDKICDRQIKELENLNQLKDDFLITVSHDLRSPPLGFSKNNRVQVPEVSAIALPDFGRMSIGLPQLWLLGLKHPPSIG